MNIQETLLTNKNTRPGKAIIPRAVVIHWTANTAKGANARKNRNYFNTTDRPASAHYIVDDTEIIRCIPENEMAYHVGAKIYKPEAARALGGYPNNATIGIEMCVNSDGDWEKTYWNTIRLVVDILVRRGWKTDRIWRHYDITGKDCPKPLLDSGRWKQFVSDVQKFCEMRTKGGVVKLADLKKELWAVEAIEKLKSRGVINSDHDPNEPVTFGVLAAIINKVLDRTEKK